MKKIIIILLSFILTCTMSGCGGNSVSEEIANKQDAQLNTNEKNEGTNSSQENNQQIQNNEQQDENKQEDKEASTGEQNQGDVSQDENKQEGQESSEQQLQLAKDGILTLTYEDMKFTYQNQSVPYPYHLNDLLEANVPCQSNQREIMIEPKSYMSLNMDLTANSFDFLIPNFYNGSEDEMLISESVAMSLTYLTYREEVIDCEGSLLGIKLGMSKDEVKALLGEPMYNEGYSFSWQIKIPDTFEEGIFNIDFTSDQDDGVVKGMYIGLS